MANAVKALIDRLLASAEVTGIVDNDIYFVAAPQGKEGPFVTLTRIDGRSEPNLSAPPSGLANARVQVDMYHKTAQGARALARVIRQSLNAFRGIQSGVDIQSVLLLDEFDGYDEISELQRVVQDYRVWYRQ